MKEDIDIDYRLRQLLNEQSEVYKKLAKDKEE